LERRYEDDSFTFEDVTLLDSIITHVSEALRAARLSEELAESREMELLSHWSSMLLHDLKNYLAPLRMTAENLLTLREKPNLKEIISADINRVADRMEALVQTLSELRQDPELSKRIVDVNELVKETVSDMRLHHPSTIQVRIDLKADQGVFGDRGMLKRVMENLIANAIEALNGRGTLTISTENQGVGTEKECTVLSVSDTGPGMAENFIREKLFRPFETTKKRGLGLGLYQCRGIVRAHRGAIRVQSQPGTATTFQVILKAASLTKSTERELRVAAAHGGVSS
jgi:signal transduction histidine kinase